MRLTPPTDAFPARGQGSAPQQVHHYFENQVMLRPDHPAVECEGETLTYAQLDQLANQIARFLRAQGVQPGSLVALCCTKSCRLFAAVLGILKAGAAYVPIDSKCPKARARDICGDADVSAVISEGSIGEEIETHAAVPVILLDRDLHAVSLYSSSPLEADFSPCNSSDVCYVIYTSGSTGKPKGVIVEHRNAVNFVQSLTTHYGIQSEDRIYQGFSTAFDASVEEIWAALSTGATLVVPSEEIARSPHDAAHFLTAHQISYFSTVPTFLAMIEAELPTVKILVVGGEACSPDLVSRWARPGRRMLNTYGPTEATVVATLADCAAGEPVTIGTALPGYETYILDESLQPVRKGEVGELYIGGAGVARGYVNRPELTETRFIQSPVLGRLYRTYDLVRENSRGAMEFIGRCDEQIKIRGFRVELSEIEAILLEHSSVRAAAVAVLDCANSKELAAYVVPSTVGGGIDRPAIAELLRAKLPEYMIPRYLDVVAELPAMTSGKVNRRRLPPPRNLLVQSTHNCVRAGTKLEEKLLSIWEQCLQVPSISVFDDFFKDLGGHSYLAASVVTKIRKNLNISHVSVRDIYVHSTIRKLATHLSANADSIRDEADTVAPSAIDAEQDPGSRRTSGWKRGACGCMQALVLILFYATFGWPAAFSILMCSAVLNQHIDIGDATAISTVVAFLIWPSWLMLGIALKWTLIGRYKAGRYPLWGQYYLRWWIVNRFQTLCWSEIFAGTPLMSLYYRAMGARVGRNCAIAPPHCSAFDLVTIGDGSSLGAETQLFAYRIEGGFLHLGEINIGRDSYIGTHCCLGLNVTVSDHAQLDDLSFLSDGTVVPPYKSGRGSPVEISDIPLELPSCVAPPRQRPLLYGFIHLGLIYAMGYLLMWSTLPACLLVAWAYFSGGPIWSIAAAFAAIPLTIGWYLLSIIAVKRIFIGRISPGTYSIHSLTYLRYWFLQYLLNNTRHLLLPIYATVWFPHVLRALGAKIGTDVEISTVMHVIPDLLEIGDGSFLADACIVGGHRIHGGLIHLKMNKIGQRSFVGNSALVPSGVEVGNAGLIGVMSTTPLNTMRTVDGTQWLGSPSFQLLRPQDDQRFTEDQTYRPSRKSRVLRGLCECIRVLLPSFVAVGGLIIYWALLVEISQSVSFTVAAICSPLILLILSFLSIACVAFFKQVLIGRFVPAVKPLWCGYVWLNEIVNSLYETLAASAMEPLIGSPLLPPFLRLMGCRIGKGVFLETTLFSEFDLVQIGDYAELNIGCTIQSHLFEDRVMKSDYLRIGESCTVGNMAVILYSTEMQRGSTLGPLSVLMKGECLPANSHWQGIPTVPAVRIAEWPKVALAESAREPSDDHRRLRSLSARRGLDKQPRPSGQLRPSQPAA